MNGNLGNVLVVIGLAVVGIGLLVKTGAMSWFGRLPGDVHVERGSTQIYVPWVSMLVISAALSLLLRLVSHFFRDR